MKASPGPTRLGRSRWGLFRVVMGLIACGVVALLAWGGVELYHTTNPDPTSEIPSTTVKRGTVIFAVHARGELQGGNSQMLTAPMAGGGDLVITSLRQAGELVQTGDVVVEFDTTDQVYRLREAQADLVENQQRVIQAEAQALAKEEEDHYLLLKAGADLRQAELEVRKNPLVSPIAAKQADLAMESARAALTQLQRDLGNRKATSQAGVAIQQAAVAKAQMQADAAQRNIDLMTLRAKAAGYVSLQPNQNGDARDGMRLPAVQVGDTVRSGMAVAQIPDMSSWEASAKIEENDRGHLSTGQEVRIEVVSLPDLPLTGKVIELGGTSGPPWDRRFGCRIAVEHPIPQLRPGMTVNIIVTEEVLNNVLWLPAQALFERDGRTFVYIQSAQGSFTPQDVKLVRRSESQIVVEGVKAGETAALANPGQQNKGKDAKKGPRSATQALPQ